MRIYTLIVMVLMFAGCALWRTPAPVPKPDPQVKRPVPPPVDPMADVPGDRPLPVAQGATERFDCKTGKEDLHARIAFEARGGQVDGFAYYSKWRPRVCSIDVQPADPTLKWRLTPEGATRVHTPNGVFVIRTQPDAYVFEFQNVQRVKYCGMQGITNGTMTVRRNTPQPECSVLGVMDR
jgi:hypothetical protein